LIEMTVAFMGKDIDMKKCDIWSLILGISKTIYFNLKELPFSEAIKFPVIISNRVKLLSLNGCVRFELADGLCVMFSRN